MPSNSEALDLEEDGALVGGAKEALGLCVGAGIRSPAVSEELAFEQVPGERGAVDRHERAGRSGAEAMDGAGYEFLAGTGLADDEHRAISGRGRMDLLKNGAHRLTPPDQFFNAVAVLALCPQCADFCLPILDREDLLDNRQNLCLIKGVSDVVGGT
jgi:hypothetical protein